MCKTGRFLQTMSIPFKWFPTLVFIQQKLTVNEYFVSTTLSPVPSLCEHFKKCCFLSDFVLTIGHNQQNLTNSDWWKVDYYVIGVWKSLWQNSSPGHYVKSQSIKIKFQQVIGVKFSCPNWLQILKFTTHNFYYHKNCK